MDTSVICAWLGIAPDQWPPDHYTLLGLPAAEADAERIEQQVQQRLERVRRYQLTHPEAATEAMNRLAQAYVCLSDPQARRAYDRSLFGGPAEGPARRNGAQEEKAPPAGPATASIFDALLEDSPTAPRPVLTSAFLRSLLESASPATSDPPLPPLPPPARSAEQAGGEPDLLSLVEEDVRAGERRPAPLPPPAGSGATPAADADDALLEEARASQKARRGLGTKRAFYQRIARARVLLRAWDQLGKYVSPASRRLAGPAEAREFLELLGGIRRLLATFPAILGEAGQPGYLVVALARQQVIVPTFQTLRPSQRDALARDWAAAQRVLAAHKDFLRREVGVLRRRTLVGRASRAFRTFLNEHPAGLLVVGGLLALAIALWREYL